MRFQVASQNVAFSLRKPGVMNDLETSKHIPLRGLQEISDENNKAALKRHARKAHHIVFWDRANPVVWNPEVFELDGEPKSVIASRKIKGEKYEPTRTLALVPLKVVGTKFRLLVLNGHAPRFRLPTLSNYPERKKAAAQYFTSVALNTVRALRKDFDGIIRLGDDNVQLDNRAEWFYPGLLLAGIYNMPQRQKTICHVTETWSSDLDLKKRFCIRKGVKSDHPIEVATYVFF